MIALLAAQNTADDKLTVLEKLQAVPRETWLSLLLALFVVWLLVRVWKSLKELNEVVPWVALICVGGTVILYWTYERTEPKILSPLFDQLSRVLPSKIHYKGNAQ